MSNNNTSVYQILTPAFHVGQRVAVDNLVGVVASVKFYSPTWVYTLRQVERATRGKRTQRFFTSGVVALEQRLSAV